MKRNIVGGGKDARKAGFWDRAAHDTNPFKGSSSFDKSYEKGWKDKMKSGSGSSGSSGGSWCFISTACVEARGLPDDCLELQLLRDFRNRFVRGLPCGAEVIAEYYQKAPLIVGRINAHAERKVIYTDLFSRLVKPSVALIRKGKYDEAFRVYRDIVRELEAKHL